LRGKDPAVTIADMVALLKLALVAGRGDPERMPDSNASHAGRNPLARQKHAAGAYDRFTRWTELPMLALSLVFLGVLVLPVLDQRLTNNWTHILGVAEVVIWAVFAVEYLVRLVLAPHRGYFIRHNIPDLLILIVPILRPLRLMRLARLARFVRGGALVARTANHSRAGLHVRVAVQAAATTVLVLFVGSVGMLDVERNAPGANIHTFGDAVWWAMTTVTTVGYGDRYPVTGEGRLIAAGVMITGIAVLGVITASIASWFVENLRAIQQTEERQAVQEQRLDTRLTEILQRLSRLEAHLGTDPTQSPNPSIQSPDGRDSPKRPGPLLA
jgi:voltage-gated potassium channel